MNMTVESTLSTKPRANESFSNQPLKTSILPNLADLNFEDLSPKYAKSRFIVNIIIFSLIVIAALILQSFDLSPFTDNVTTGYLITLVFAGLTLLLSIYLFFADQHKYYALREQDLSYASGLIFKKIVTQPILRIQHIELKRGPIARKIGLANLQVFSAGGALHTFEIPGLPLKTAEKIRQFILQHKDITEVAKTNNDTQLTSSDLNDE